MAMTAQDSFGYIIYPSVQVNDMVTKSQIERSSHPVNTVAIQAISVCGGNLAYSSASQMQVVFWPPPGGGALNATAEVAECILGASGATVRASLPSIILLRRANATAVFLTASGVNVGGPLVIKLEGVSLSCGTNAGAYEENPVWGVNTSANAIISTTVILALPTQKSLLGKSVTTVCTAAAVLE